MRSGPTPLIASTAATTRTRCRWSRLNDVFRLPVVPAPPRCAKMSLFAGVRRPPVQIANATFTGNTNVGVQQTKASVIDTLANLKIRPIASKEYPNSEHVLFVRRDQIF